MSPGLLQYSRRDPHIFVSSDLLTDAKTGLKKRKENAMIISENYK
jgi:hypothetical protein